MSHNPEVNSFFHEPSNTVTYVLTDPETKACAIIDSVLDYDHRSGSTSTTSADDVIQFVNDERLSTQWILETHAHADHLSAAPYLRKQLGGKITIGSHIPVIQKTFGELLNEDPSFKRDGGQFEKLLDDDECFHIGKLEVKVIHVPGHTPACVAYSVGDCVFVGDTLFMPDYGSARCDFPGGDAGKLYDSVQNLYQLPDETRMFLCHDYKAEGREKFAWQTTVLEQKKHNIHLNTRVTRDEFIKMRRARDKTLGMPRLIFPSIQINLRAGEFPVPEKNGTSYIKIPLNSG